jgi:hypothetical protein
MRLDPAAGDTCDLFSGLEVVFNENIGVLKTPFCYRLRDLVRRGP